MTGKYNDTFVCYYHNPIYPSEMLLSYDGLLYDFNDTEHISDVVRAYYTLQQVKHKGLKDIAHNGCYSREDVDYISKVLTQRAKR
jgi:hypothetical protein